MIRLLALAVLSLAVIPTASAEGGAIPLSAPLPGLTSDAAGVDVERTCYRRTGETMSTCERLFHETYTAQATAVDCAEGGTSGGFTEVTCTATVPGIDASQFQESGGALNFFLSKLYVYLTGTAALLALLMIVWGALQIATSGGGSGVGEGKTRIIQALTGLALLMLVGVILHTLNPAVYTMG